ncbi:hypothetical protein DL764_005723 [Monosporascus ibericus]|uniref:RRM domain-containing protein n=1 Tax=Monosporascus ibericus TaxID=155417 RepID=A0A4Q4TBD3_9PEZI|nr:hypothetical protein DL764_005723 [Monosporascus ibericus]
MSHPQSELESVPTELVGMTGDNLPPERYETLDPEEERSEFLRLLCRNEHPSSAVCDVTKSTDQRRGSPQGGRRHGTVLPGRLGGGLTRVFSYIPDELPPLLLHGIWKYRKEGRDIAGLGAALERDAEQAGHDPMPWTQNGTWCINHQQGIFVARPCRLMPEERCTMVYRKRLCPHHCLNVRVKHLLDPQVDTGMPPVVFRGARGIIHGDDPALAVVTSWYYLGPGTTPEDIVDGVRYSSEGLGEPSGVARLSGLFWFCVYIRNLEERVKPDALKSALSAVFSEYGNIIDIVIKTNLKAKGQAFVVFDKPESAHHAIEETQGFELFEKPMQVALARTRSDATVKSTGNEQELEQHQRRRLAEKERKKAAEAQEEQKRLKRPGAVPAAEANRPAKAARGPGLKPTGPAANAVVPDEYLPPNKILFVQNLPDDYDIEALTGIFGRFEGFREVRLVPGRKGIAFIEYEAEAGAITAKENTAGMALADGTKFMKVTYQRQYPFCQ